MSVCVTSLAYKHTESKLWVLGGGVLNVVIDRVVGSMMVSRGACSEVPEG